MSSKYASLALKASRKRQLGCPPARRGSVWATIQLPVGGLNPNCVGQLRLTTFVFKSNVAFRPKSSLLDGMDGNSNLRAIWK